MPLLAGAWAAFGKMIRFAKEKGGKNPVLFIATRRVL
jgi:hypothetical protein